MSERTICKPRKEIWRYLLSKLWKPKSRIASKLLYRQHSMLHFSDSANLGVKQTISAFIRPKPKLFHKFDSSCTSCSSSKNV